MRRALGILAGLSGVMAMACAAEQTWTGQISDNHCTGAHLWDEHRSMSERDCTLMCIKSGAAFVLVTEGKVYAIANQDHPGLSRYAGSSVRLTGQLGNEAIRVSRVEAP